MEPAPEPKDRLRGKRQNMSVNRMKAIVSRGWRRASAALWGGCLAVTAFGVQAQGAAPVAQKTPAWAYPMLGTAPPSPPNDGIQHRIEGSPLAFTMTQLFDTFTAHDWFPQSHPPMPEVVARGRQPEVRACGMCHYPNGQGRPENAALAGLPSEYIVQQVRDYQSGLRRSSEPNAGPHLRMLSTSMNVNSEDLQSAARYFSALKYRPWIKVIESDMAPKSEVVIGSMWAAVAGAGMEPLGQRIVEVPADLHLTELRDPRSGFVAYVPPGSIARGEKLSTTGDGKTLPCVSCHGPDLRGIGLIPPLAGRSTQYLVRQLVDFQRGSRKGLAGQPMKEVVGQLTLDDMIALAAYAASREP